MFENVPALHYSLDGVAAGGNDNEIYVAYHSEAELASAGARGRNLQQIAVFDNKKSVAKRVAVLATRG